MAAEIEDINKSFDQALSSEEEFELEDHHSSSSLSSAESLSLISKSVIGGCLVCGLDDNYPTLLLCDVCDGAYHLACLSPPTLSVPEGDWICCEFTLTKYLLQKKICLHYNYSYPLKLNEEVFELQDINLVGRDVQLKKTCHKRGHRCIKAALAILRVEGYMRKEALREIGNQRRRGALASLEVQGFTGEGAASSELGHRGRRGALNSLEAQGFTGEGAESSELARRCGEACSAIYRISGNCIYPGCAFAISTGEFCGKHKHPKPEKSD